MRWYVIIEYIHLIPWHVTREKAYNIENVVFDSDPKQSKKRQFLDSLDHCTVSLAILLFLSQA